MITVAGINDLPKLERCAREFYASSQFLRKFDMGRFLLFWNQAIGTGMGVVYMLPDAAGAIGGVVYPDLYSGELIATEFFWFVRDGHRGDGLKLYRAFENWARQKGCAQIRMVHLLDSMPEKLQRVYRHLGYTPAEVHYTKELI